MVEGIIFIVIIDVKKRGGGGLRMEWLDHKSGRVITYLLDKLKDKLKLSLDHVNFKEKYFHNFQTWVERPGRVFYFLLVFY
jgi:hypothetical protein